MQRPPQVPADATWSDDDNEWISAERDAQDRLQGDVRYYRPDGSLCCATAHVDGVPHGSFKRFHENGETAREGRFTDGTLDGTHVFWRSTGTTSEQFPPGLDDAVWRCEMDYRDGDVVGGRLFDRDGELISHGGQAQPARPAGVPPEAVFGEHDDEPRWIVGSAHDNSDGTVTRQGSWRYFNESVVLVCEERYDGGALVNGRRFDEESGALVSETELRDGKPHGYERSYGEDGTLIGESSFVAGQRRGAYWRKPYDGELTFEAAREEGTWHESTPVGERRYLDAAGQLLQRVDLGEGARNDKALMQLLRAPASSDFAAQATTLAALPPLALAAELRAAARANDATQLRQFLATRRIPTSEGYAGHLTQHALQVHANLQRFGSIEAQCHHLLSEVLLGGVVVELLRALAITLDQAGDRTLSVAALDFIDAALLLAPQPRLHFTRALTLMSLGRPHDAQQSVTELAKGSPEQAEFLRTYVKAIFPRFDFTPPNDARQPLLRAASVDARPLVRDRTELVALATALAARIERRRAALVPLTSDDGWLPPRLDALLAGAAPNDDDIEADVPSLAQSLGRDWLRLSWLCWLVGGDDLTIVAEPHAARAPATLAEVCATRVRLIGGDEPEGDLETLIAASRWNDVPVSTLGEGVAEIAVHDDEALAALATWLVDADADHPLEA